MNIFSPSVRSCRSIWIAAFVTLFIMPGALPARAAELDHPVQFSIPAQPLSSALLQFAEQSKIQVLTESEVLDGYRTSGVQGRITARAALEKILDGTGLSFRKIGSGTVTIRKDIDAAAAAATHMAQAGAAAAGSDFQTDGSGRAEKSADPQSAQSTVGEKLEEIIVTATKREESAQDIPMSIAVIRNQDIERRGLVGMEDYLRSIPGVSQIDNGPLSNAIVIRGITTTPEFENFASGTTVASYFDEAPTTAAGGLGTGGIDIRPVDIERIEVLRGPQGTAYGSASLGGTLRVIPVKPKLDAFSAAVAGNYSGTSGEGGDNSMLQGIVNIPLVTGKLALRAVGYRYDDSGYYRNIAGIDATTLATAQSMGLGDYVAGYVQDEVGRIVSTGARLAALWQATEKLDLSLTWLSQKIEQDGSFGTQFGDYRQARFPIAPQGRVRGEPGEVNDTEIDLLSFVLNYDLGWAALTSAASWVDSGSINAETINFAAFGSSTTAPSDFDSFSAEARLASRFNGRFQFLGGLFYEDVQNEYQQALAWPGPPAGNPFGTNPGYIYREARDLEQRALFGEISYDLTDKLTATAGGRFFKYKKAESQLAEGGLYGVPLGGGVWNTIGSEESNSSFKASLSYKPVQDTLLYASWSEGFRLGRPTAGLPDICDVAPRDGVLDGTSISIASTRSIDADFLESYEVGAKFAFFDRRLIVDAAAYHIDWDGLPVRQSADACGLSYVANAGGASSDGIEFQASLAVAAGLRVDFGAGYTKAELTEDAPNLNAQDGARLPGAPKVNANLAVQYDFALGGRKAFVRGDSTYVGSFYGDLLSSPSLRAGDYVRVDARFGIAIKALDVELFARNLTNEDAFTWQSFATGGYLMRPRTLGIQLGYRFE